MTHNLALFGITGALGREIQTALEVEHEGIEQLFPVAGVRSAGQLIRLRGDTLPVSAPAELKASDVDFAIFATPADVPADYYTQLRTNQHFTLKTNPLKRAHLDEFVKLYNPANRHDRKPTWSEQTPEGRFRAYGYDELVSRDKASLDIFWLRDESLSDSDNLPPPDVIAQEIVEDLEAALEQFRLIAGDLGAPEEVEVA